MFHRQTLGGHKGVSSAAAVYNSFNSKHVAMAWGAIQVGTVFFKATRVELSGLCYEAGFC